MGVCGGVFVGVWGGVGVWGCSWGDEDVRDCIRLSFLYLVSILFLRQGLRLLLNEKLAVLPGLASSRPRDLAVSTPSAGLPSCEVCLAWMWDPGI